MNIYELKHINLFMANVELENVVWFYATLKNTLIEALKHLKILEREIKVLRRFSDKIPPKCAVWVSHHNCYADFDYGGHELVDDRITWKNIII